MEVLEIAGAQGADGVSGAEDRVTVGMFGPQPFGEQLEDEIIRRVLDRGDLLQHHVPLQVEVAGPEQGTVHQIGQDIDRLGKVLIEDVSLVVGVIAAGIGIEGTAPDFELERQLPGVSALGALEHHVLEQMGYAHLGARLVGAGGP